MQDGMKMVSVAEVTNSAADTLTKEETSAAADAIETDEERAEREGEAIQQKHIHETLLEQKIKTS